MHRIWNRIVAAVQSEHKLVQQQQQCTRHFSSRRLKHNERKLVRIPPDIMFETVKDVDNYKNFVPYCLSSVVTSRYENGSRAKLSVGFGPVTENYTSVLKFDKPHFVEALCSDGKLFNSLNCMWRFKPVKSPHMCIIDFHVDFEFRSAFYSSLATLFFNEIVRTMVSAFESEAKRQMALKDRNNSDS